MDFIIKHALWLEDRSRPRGYKTFSCSTFRLRISTAHKTKIPPNEEVSQLRSLRCCIYHANIYLNTKNC